MITYQTLWFEHRHFSVFKLGETRKLIHLDEEAQYDRKSSLNTVIKLKQTAGIDSYCVIAVYQYTDVFT